ncbi:MAG: hypothetical protein IKS42_12045 [Oscillospiraceae bacterium]|nr:hypothetical protein [Oscillospiraceae bacterium]
MTQNQIAAAAPDTAFASELRAKAEAHGAVQVDLHSILFQQGRAIARAYVDMMKSYAGLTARSGRYQQQGDRMIVTGFCRIEEEHFDREPLLVREQHLHNPLTAKLSDLGRLREQEFSVRESDLFAAFLTSFSEFCAAEGIRTGALSMLVRRKDGSTEVRELPAALRGSEHAEAIGFPYQIEF